MLAGGKKSATLLKKIQRGCKGNKHAGDAARASSVQNRRALPIFTLLAPVEMRSAYALPQR